MGWRGSAAHWHRYETAYLLMAGLATPLVISVHSIVGMDFAAAIVPGWHTTIFPPYFVAGAIFSGFAMVVTLAIPLRAVYRLQDFVTMRHLDNMAKIMLATGSILAYGYLRRGVLFVLQRQPVRTVCHHQPGVRTLRLELLGADRLQHSDSSTAVVSSCAP